MGTQITLRSPKQIITRNSIRKQIRKKLDINQAQLRFTGKCPNCGQTIGLTNRCHPDHHTGNMYCDLCK